MSKTGILIEGKTVTLFVVIAFAVAGLTAVTFLSGPIVVAQGLGNASNSIMVAQGLGNISDPTVVAQLSGLSQHPNLAPGNVSNSSVMAQSPGNDPNDCFRTIDNIDTCPMHTHLKGLINATTDCFKIVGEAKVSTGDTQNYTKSVQSFFSLLPANDQLTSINENIAGGSGPVTDMKGIWKLMGNEVMTRNDRQMVLNEIDSILAAAQPGFTQIQQDALSFCFIDETDALGASPNY